MARLAIEVWSGAQTGVDRAALDAALALGLPIGGWIPLGRLAEDGEVPPGYPGLRETDSADYEVRTHRNVQDTDATLVLTWGPATGGTRETIAIARRLGRPLLVLDLTSVDAALGIGEFRRWFAGLAPPERSRLRLNVAGPRASHAPELYARARAFLGQALSTLLLENPAGEDTIP